jgi:hypothetical protein
MNQEKLGKTWKVEWESQANLVKNKNSTFPVSMELKSWFCLNNWQLLDPSQGFKTHSVCQQEVDTACSLTTLTARILH